MHLTTRECHRKKNVLFPDKGNCHPVTRSILIFLALTHSLIFSQKDLIAGKILIIKYFLRIKIYCVVVCYALNERFERFYRRYRTSMKQLHLLDYRIVLSIHGSRGLSL